MRKLICRVKGGLGNQLFCYAAAKRLALTNNAELVIDNITGFLRDRQYKRKYALDRFAITCRLATPFERYWPFEPYRRAIDKLTSRFVNFPLRKYIEQEISDYDPRLLKIRLSRDVTTIDGLWQSELYFKDISNVIRRDLIIEPPKDKRNLSAKNWIVANNAIAIHVRWFGGENSVENAPIEYYKNAIKQITKLIRNPYYAIFSDNPEKSKLLLDISDQRSILINWNNNYGGEVDDLWLMTHCQHFIISNSTFSWWGAWLGSNYNNNIVYFPRRNFDKELWAWDYQGQMPEKWIPIFVK